MKPLACLTPSVIVFALALSAAPAAEAQFGGLMKKAKEKIADKTKEDLGPIAAGEQLTDDLLGKVIIGAQTADRILDEREKFRTAGLAKDKELSPLVEANGPVHHAYNEAHSKINACRSATLSELERGRSERTRARRKEMQSDPAAAGKMQLVMMKYGKAIADAHQRQDPVALTKLQNEMNRELMGEDAFPDVSKDSVAADTKCGTLPALPASLAQEQRVRKEITAIGDSIRTLEARAITQGAQAAGLDKLRYLQLKERALWIMKRINGGGVNARYSDEEMAAVKKRIDDLEKVKRVL